MKKHVRKMLCLLMVLLFSLSLVLPVCAETPDTENAVNNGNEVEEKSPDMPVPLTLALMGNSAPEDMTVAETQNGKVEVTEDQEGYLITLSPAKGYMTDSLSLRDEDGIEIAVDETETVNVFRCDDPEKPCTLTVVFRRGRIILNKDELALDSGDHFQLSATMTYTDGEIKTRKPVARQEVVYSSTNEAIVSVNALTGKLTAHRMGYARINVSAKYGKGVEDFVYVIVDGDKSPVVGTIQLNAYFDEDKLLNGYGGPGHGFLIFENTGGEDITINTSGFYQCEVPNETFYQAVNAYTGEGVDPLSYMAKTGGNVEYNDDDEEELQARTAWASHYFTRYERQPGGVYGEENALKTYTIKNNDIATFGNTGALDEDETFLDVIIGGDFKEVLERYGKLRKLEELETQLKNREIDYETYINRIADLAKEIGYDLSTGYNPFNYQYKTGGVCLNHELYAQAFNRDYSHAQGCRVAITKIQLEAMVDFLQYNNYFNILERNCSWASSDAWNLVTAKNPAYHIEPNIGGVTTALAVPIFLRNNIYAKSLVLAYDENITFINGIGVIKPKKTGCAAGNHIWTATQSGAKITRAGVYKCQYCDAEKEGTTLTEITLKKGDVYRENVLGIWTSSNLKTAIVSPLGLIYAKKAGTTVIKCRRGSTTYTCKVTVSQ